MIERTNASKERGGAVNNLDGALAEHFGFQEWKAGQEEVCRALMAGHSAAAVFPTGGGKSLCYQLPALLLPGLTLVVSPLIALMKDQIDALRARGIAAARIDSTLDGDTFRSVMEEVRSQRLRLLYVAPERFNNERFREMLQQIPVSLFAIDEAHCISEWGHNFRPDYLKLPRIARAAQADRVLALTATATEQVLDDICREFNIAPEHAFRTGFYRPNLELQTTSIDGRSRDRFLLSQIQERPRGPTVVYVTLQRTAEQVAHRLAAANLPARHYHAGMEPEDRSTVQEWFLASDSAIVVATIAFGMGIDKADIRYVYHYNLPKSLESYSQEIGRAGRDGAQSTCHMLACMDDTNILENFAYGDTPTIDAIRALVHDLLGQEERFDISVNELSARHDIRFLVARTLLTHLELDGIIEGGTPFYTTYRFKPLKSSKEILSRFEGDRRAFLTRVLQQVEKSKIWFRIDTDAAAAATDSSRERVIRALDFLAEEQLIELRSEGVRYRYRRLKDPEDRDALVQSLWERMQSREKREVARLQQVIDLATHDGCQTAFLSAHFGERLQQDCGHCSFCKSQEALKLPDRAIASIDDDLWQKALALRAANPVLSSPRALTRFLCGLTSPQLSRAKLSKEPLFGKLSAIPFGLVLERAEGLEGK